MRLSKILLCLGFFTFLSGSLLAGNFAKFVNNSAYPVVLMQLNNVGATAPLTATFEQGFEPTFFIPANSSYEYTLPVVDGPTNGGDDIASNNFINSQN